MKRNLRKAILSALGTAAMVTLSTQASAFEAHDFGVLNGKASKSHNDLVPFKAYTDYQAQNQGWMHTADFHIFTLGTPEEIAAGIRYDVAITMKARGTGQDGAQGPLDNPAFTVWTLGQNSYRPVSATNHGWAQLRGPNDDVANPRSNKPGKLPNGEVVIANNVDNGDSAGLGDNGGATPNGIPDGGFLAMGVIDGHDGWIGYAQSGPSVTVVYNLDPLNFNPQTKLGTVVTDELPFGSYVNRKSPYVNGKKSKGKVTSGKALDLARLTLKQLKAGTYLIGSGGSCGTVEPIATCTQGQAYRLTIATKPLN